MLFVARTIVVAADSLRIFALSVLVYSATGSPLLGALAFGAGDPRKQSAVYYWARWLTGYVPGG